MGYFESRKGGPKVCTWADGTDEEIVEALRAHYAGEIDLHDFWTVGDKRTVTLSAMSATGVSESHAQQSVTYVLSHVGGKTLVDGTTTCAFQVDQVDSLNEGGYMNSSNTNSGGWKNSARRTWCNNVYKNAIPSTLRGIFKEFINQSGTGGGSSSGVENTTDTFALRAEIEVIGSASNSVTGEGSQIAWYETSSNRNKKKNGSEYSWWERSPMRDYAQFFLDIDSGSSKWEFASTDYIGISPFGCI